MYLKRRGRVGLDIASPRLQSLGDMNPTFYLSPRKPGALIIPTATSDILGSLKHEWVFDLVSRDHRRLASRSR